MSKNMAYELVEASDAETPSRLVTLGMETRGQRMCQRQGPLPD